MLRNGVFPDRRKFQNIRYKSLSKISYGSIVFQHVTAMNKGLCRMSVTLSQGSVRVGTTMEGARVMCVAMDTTTILSVCVSYHTSL
jgi:hypothetical protein